MKHQAGIILKEREDGLFEIMDGRKRLSSCRAIIHPTQIMVRAIIRSEADTLQRDMEEFGGEL